MIISYKNNYVFIKTLKVAGTSVEMALSKYCGPDDIITQIAPQDEIARFKMGVVPRNFCKSKRVEKEYVKAIETLDEQKVHSARINLRGKILFRQHMPANLAFNKIDKDFVENAFKFTIDRHPYDKALSLAYYRAYNKYESTKYCYLKKELYLSMIKRKFNNFKLYSINGNICVDCILKYEMLSKELKSIAAKIGKDISGELPFAKAGIRKRREAPCQLLNAFERWLIRKICKKEFYLHNYNP